MLYILMDRNNQDCDLINFNSFLSENMSWYHPKVKVKISVLIYDDIDMEGETGCHLEDVLLEKYHGTLRQPQILVLISLQV